MSEAQETQEVHHPSNASGLSPYSTHQLSVAMLLLALAAVVVVLLRWVVRRVTGVSGGNGTSGPNRRRLSYVQLSLFAAVLVSAWGAYYYTGLPPHVLTSQERLSIQPGMSPAEVFALAGRPYIVKQRDDGSTVWLYGQSTGDGILFRDGLVESVTQYRTSGSSDQ